MNVPSKKPSSFGLTQKEKDGIVVDIESSPPKQKEMGLKKNTEYSSDDQTRDSLPVTHVVATSANKFAILDTIQEEEGEIVEDVTLEDGLNDSEPTDNSENRQNDTDFADDGLVGKNSEIGETIIIQQGSWSEGDMDDYEDQERVTAQGFVSLAKKRGRKMKAELAKLHAGVALRRLRFHGIVAVGEDFTWGGTQSTGWVAKKLDRVLFTKEWNELFPVFSVENPNRTTSDHSPILHLFGHQIASKPKTADGETLTNMPEIEQEAVQFYKELLQDDNLDVQEEEA
ncbi:OLC1v1023930C1 [Oldenlandia corymbosa var. corymbosa]|uniref:OLC1v1023930C1 n=1 Tax=Oldenlandia corymbosa var. corymbosa TaxID=529605 RepID=A0AAV1C125_OLDCO|nr:OLC1v1023930C1 [Oldenlandia corymbosa var. corymbosa]